MQVKKQQLELGTEQWTGSKNQGCVLSTCLFNLYTEYIMQNARLDEAQSGIKIDGRNIDNLRYEDDTTLMAESEEKEESEKAGLEFNSKKTKIMASIPITWWQIDGETMETVRDFILGGLQNHCGQWLQPRN